MYRFDASGTQTLIINSGNHPPSPAFSAPDGVAVDAAGNIYAADPGSDTVYRFCTGVPALGATVGGDGHSVTVTGSGFGPGATVTVDIASTPAVLGTVTVDSTGAFSKSFAVPCSIGAGDHTVTATGPLGQSAFTSVALTACPVAITVTPKFTG